MKKIFSAMLIALACISASAQQYTIPRETMARMFPAGVVSPQINEDGSVTFRFQAPNAQQVQLNCQMLERNAPMVKDEAGVWSVTVKPKSPDIYPYCFIVDGTQIADPNNV